MKNWKASLLLLLAMQAASYAMSQPRPIKRLGMEDGLSSNYAVSITQDKKGYIWIATESGLNRFDGQHFTKYTKENSGLTGNELNSVLADPIEDKVWIGTQRNGLCVFDYNTERITSIPAGPNGMLTNDVTHLAAASDSGIWITHYHFGIDYYNQKTKKFVSYASKNVRGLEGHHWTAIDDGNGRLYIGHNTTGMSIVSIADRTVKKFMHKANDPSSIPGNEVRAICIDKSKNVWVGTNSGLALFNPRSGKFTTFRHIEGNPKSLLSDQILDIKQMRNGSLWICSNMGGISILDLQDNTIITPDNIQFRNITAGNGGNGLSGPNVKNAVQDSFGNIWIANYRGGVNFISYSTPIFKVLPYERTKSSANSSQQVWGLWTNSNNQIWMSGEGEFGAFDINKGKIRSLPISSNAQTHINTILQDKSARLWLGTYKNGVLRYTPQNQRLEHIDNTLDVGCFFEDADGKIWIGSQTGLYSYSKNCIALEKNIMSQLPDIMIHGIVRDKEGKLWIGTFSKGITIFDKNDKRILNLTTDNGLLTNAVNHIIKDSKGRIWVATRDGIVLFSNTNQPSAFNNLGKAEGLENSQVRALIEDQNGEIWMSTNGGIALYNEKKGVFYNYNHKYGVPLGDFMDGAACMAPNGTLFFASQYGVCYFDPQRLISTRKVAPITITQFCIYNQSKGIRDDEDIIPTAKGKVSLTYKQNTFKISFNILDYTQNPQAEFSYMLSGLDNSWYSTQGDNQVTFRNIPPGNYTFKVRTRIRNQQWEDSIATLSIHIAPPFWLSWYAKAIYILLLGFVCFAIVRFYKRKIDLESSLELERRKALNTQELNSERLRFYTNITHELRTPLTLILGPLEDLINDPTLAAKHANKIGIIHKSATRLLNLINRILEFRKTETENRKLNIAKGNIGQLVQEIGLRYKELNTNSKIQYSINISTQETTLFFDADVITIILDNLLSNAAKYTQEGSISVGLNTFTENSIKYTEICIADTGQGIEPVAMPHIFERYYQGNSKMHASGSGIGLALAKSLADLHQGYLTAESVLGEGTTFKLRLLTENSYPNAAHIHCPDIKRAEDAEASEAEPSEGKPIVLVVEDNEDIREYIKSSLNENFEIITAKDGKEGWDEAQKHIPNIIVADIMMPVMDGLGLCRKVKEDMRTSHIPVIFLTAKDSLQDKEEGYTSGADSYLTKPFSAKLLQSRINNLLETRKKIASQLASHTQAKQENAIKSLNKLDNKFIQKITEIIEENLSMERMDIAFIAEKMCMSHSTLYRKIKGLTDVSANEFIRKVKMRNGVRLLLEGEYTISEISYMIGFSSVAYFRQCFKEEYGMAPSDYIKKLV